MKFIKLLIIGNTPFSRNLMEYFTYISKIDDIDIQIDNIPYSKDFPSLKNYHWVINCHLPTDTHDIDYVLVENFDFNKSLFKECNYHGINYQWVSSYKVYGYDNHHPNEFSSCSPIDNLSFSQYLFDRWVFNQEINIIAQGFRHFELYGKYMLDDIFNQYLNEIKHYNKITLDTNSFKIKKDFVWVQDVCKIHYKFLTEVKGSGLWNVGSGLSHSLFDIADEIATNNDIEIDYVNLNSSVMNIRSDNSSMKKTIGSINFLNIFEFLDKWIT